MGSTLTGVSGMTDPGRHERRGRHEACGASVGAVFWGYICDRIAGHGGSHWADDLKFNAPRGPITYPEVPKTITARMREILKADA